MAASYTRESAAIQEVYQRRILPAGDKYIRQPWNLIKYEGDSSQYLEPLPWIGPGDRTFYDLNNDDTDAEWLIVDVPPFQGVTEIR